MVISPLNQLFGDASYKQWNERGAIQADAKLLAQNAIIFAVKEHLSMSLKKRNNRTNLKIKY